MLQECNTIETYINPLFLCILWKTNITLMTLRLQKKSTKMSLWKRGWNENKKIISKNRRKRPKEYEEDF